MSIDPQSLPFRREAAEHYARRKLEGRVLRIAPGWTRYTYWLLLAVLLAAAIFMSVATVHEYAPAPAIIRLTQRVSVAAPIEGVVAQVHVSPGQRVEAGAPIVELDATTELFELERLERESAAATARFLSNPSDLDARQRLGALRAQTAEARARMLRKTITASEPGIVGDVRAQPGEKVAPGDELATIGREGSGARIIAIVPAHYRPLLRPGLPLRLRFESLSYAYRHLVVESVAEDALGPNDARRVLGPDLSDAVVLEGPVVLVEALVEHPYVESGQTRFDLHDGMLGKAEISVRKQPLIFAVIPGLHELWMEDPS